MFKNFTWAKKTFEEFQDFYLYAKNEEKVLDEGQKPFFVAKNALMFSTNKFIVLLFYDIQEEKIILKLEIIKAILDSSSFLQYFKRQAKKVKIYCHEKEWFDNHELGCVAEFVEEENITLMDEIFEGIKTKKVYFYDSFTKSWFPQIIELKTKKREDLHKSKLIKKIKDITIHICNTLLTAIVTAIITTSWKT